mmetsp:Transcript_40985/g.64647  ORF Transcript_40985/g.64647 Transcript_40985/m.64647 type:complete len:269 (-) Transcript_40985:347-1153(-)
MTWMRAHPRNMFRNMFALFISTKTELYFASITTCPWSSMVNQWPQTHHGEERLHPSLPEISHLTGQEIHPGLPETLHRRKRQSAQIIHHGGSLRKLLRATNLNTLRLSHACKYTGSQHGLQWRPVKRLLKVCRSIPSTLMKVNPDQRWKQKQMGNLLTAPMIIRLNPEQRLLWLSVTICLWCPVQVQVGLAKPWVLNLSDPSPGDDIQSRALHPNPVTGRMSRWRSEAFSEGFLRWASALRLQRAGETKESAMRMMQQTPPKTQLKQL